MNSFYKNSENQDNIFTSLQSQNTNFIEIGKDFLRSNNIIAKCSFLLIIIFLFVILLKLGIFLISWLFSESNSPHLFDGMINGNQLLIFHQNPSVYSDAVVINRSNNAKDGIEFTWSSWLFIDDPTPSTHYRHIFHKGNSDINDTGLNFPNNAPGVYLTPNTNGITIIMNTFSTINEEILVNDIPIHKWFSLVIRCENKIMDIYVNGTIVTSHKFTDVPKQNYGDVYVAMNGGFPGNMSNLWYYDYALSPISIQSIVSSGPNTKLASMSGSYVNNKDVDYLSSRWYFYN